MLAYLLLIQIPAPLLIYLAATVMCGVLGWRRTASQARAAWDRAVVVAGNAGQGAYRAAPRQTRLLPTPRLVLALGVTSHALHAGHACALAVFAIEATCFGISTVAATALYLATLGVIMSRAARDIVTRAPLKAKARAVRRRVCLCTALALPTHGTIVLGIAALKMGWLDMLYCDAHYPGIKGISRWEGMTVRAFLDLDVKPSLFGGPLVGHHGPYAWNMLGLAVLVYSCLSLIEAALVLAVVYRRSASIRDAHRVALRRRRGIHCSKSPSPADFSSTTAIVPR